MALTSKVNTNIKTLFDLSIELYGNSKYVFKLIEDNPVLIPTLQTEITVGMEIIYDDTLVFDTEKEEEIELIQPAFKYVTIRENQSLFDIALQVYGGVEGVFQILTDNTQIKDINADYITGMNMKYIPQTFAITEYFRTQGISITTGADNGRSFNDSFSWSFN